MGHEHTSSMQGSAENGGAISTEGGGRTERKGRFSGPQKPDERCARDGLEQQQGSK